MGLIILNLDKGQVERNLPSRDTCGRSVTFLANAVTVTTWVYEMRVGNIVSCAGCIKVNCLAL